MMVEERFYEWLDKKNVDMKDDDLNLYGALHNKFVVVDWFDPTNEEGPGEEGNDPLLVTGSFNYTPGAATHNYENILTDTRPAVVTAYANHFDKVLMPESLPL